MNPKGRGKWAVPVNAPSQRARRGDWVALGRGFGYDPFILSSFGGMVRALRSGAQRRCLSGEDETWRPIYPVPLG